MVRVLKGAAKSTGKGGWRRRQAARDGADLIRSHPELKSGGMDAWGGGEGPLKRRRASSRCLKTSPTKVGSTKKLVQEDVGAHPVVVIYDRKPLLRSKKAGTPNLVIICHQTQTNEETYGDRGRLTAEDMRYPERGNDRLECGPAVGGEHGAKGQREKKKMVEDGPKERAAG